MNNEPNIALPKPPLNHVWQYRGMGWTNGQQNTTYCVWSSNNDDPVDIGRDCAPAGALGLHYWEAVPLADAAILEFERGLETELDVARWIAEALGEEVAELEKAAAKFLGDMRRYHDLLVQCGQAIGREAYTNADGTTQQDVLVDKVPELVRKLKAMTVCDVCQERNVARGKVDSVANEPDLGQWLGETAVKTLGEAAAIDLTEGGKYRMLDEGELVERGDEYFWCDQKQWTPVGSYVGRPFHEPFWGSPMRRRIDFAQQAKDILADINEAAPVVSCNNFVDLIIKAAKQ